MLTKVMAPRAKTVELMKRIEKELSKKEYRDGSWTAKQLAAALHEPVERMQHALMHMGYETVWKKRRNVR